MRILILGFLVCANLPAYAIICKLDGIDFNEDGIYDELVVGCKRGPVYVGHNRICSYQVSKVTCLKPNGSVLSFHHLTSHDPTAVEYPWQCRVNSPSADGFATRELAHRCLAQFERTFAKAGSLSGIGLDLLGIRPTYRTYEQFRETVR